MQGQLQIALLSPGFIFEPYEPREKIPFWKRLDLNGFIFPRLYM